MAGVIISSGDRFSTEKVMMKGHLHVTPCSKQQLKPSWKDSELQCLQTLLSLWLVHMPLILPI